MDREFSFNIDKNIFNIFSSKSISELQKEYNLNNYYYLNQIHSSIIHIVDNKYRNNTSGDALITNKLNMPLVIRTADCIPIILYDNKAKVLAVIHSGWKGTLNNIVGATIKKMINKFNCNKDYISAYLYPFIRQCHFEVDNDVYTKFKDKITCIDDYVITKGTKYYIDLQAIVKANLKELGIEKIYDSNICTYCNSNKFYSYRYNHTDKRNYLIAYIKE